MKLASHPLTFPELLFILLMLLVPSLMDPKLSNLAANLLQGSISRTFYEKLLFLQIRKRKNSVKLSVSFYAFEICIRKSCSKNSSYSRICQTCERRCANAKFLMTFLLIHFLGTLPIFLSGRDDSFYKTRSKSYKRNLVLKSLN